MAFKLLLVDDEPSNIHVLRAILQDDYDLMFAKSGTKAIELAHEQHPDLILLDVMMPEMNGYEVCRELKSVEQTKDIPVIFVSALDEKHNEVEGIQVGGSDFLIKPVFPDLVKHRVDKILSLSRMSALRESVAQVLDVVTELGSDDDSVKASAEQRIAKLCVWLAKKYDLPSEQIDDLRLAYPLRHLGRLTSKSADLYESDNWFLKRFEGISEGFIYLCSTLIRHQDTRWDGSGTPDLKGADIPAVSRISLAAQFIDHHMWINDGDLPRRFSMMLEALSRYVGSWIDPLFLLILQTNKDDFCQHYEKWLVREAVIRHF